MKVLKFLILLLISGKSFAQYTPIHTPTIWDMGGFKALFIGDTTYKPTDNTRNWIAIQGTTLYKWDSGGWVAISGGGGGGDVTPYTLPQATPLIRGGITYNTDFYIDANGRLAIDTSKKNLWNQIALLPYYSTTAQMRGEIRDTANARNLTFGSAFLRTGNNIDLIQQPFVEKDSIFTNSPAASLTVDNMSDINGIMDTSIHATPQYVRSLLGSIKKDTITFNRAHFYKKSDSTVNLNIKSINGIKLYGDTSNIVIAGGSGGGANLPYNGDSSFYFGGDTTLHRLPVAPATSDSIDYAFTAMTTVYNEAGPGEYVSSASGVTANKDNFNFPFRQLKSLNIGAWADGNYVSFTNGTISSSTNFTFLRAFIRLKSALPVSTTISFAFYYNGTLVSKTISCVNYGLDKNKVGVYQNISIPISAFGFTANNFNELRLKLGGTQSDGIYMDLVQFQNASVFENTFITDLFKKPLTDSVFKVVGGINVYAFRDSGGGSTIDTASMLSPYLKSSVAASSYFPLQGGAITGTGGNGYVGFIPQSVSPTTPASGFKLFATSPGAFAWLTSQGYARELRVRAQTQNNIYYLQDKSYTLADSADVAGKLNIADTANIRLRAIAGTNMTITGTYPNLTFNSTSGGGGTVTGGSITWPGSIYSSPTTGTVTSGSMGFSPTLNTQTANTFFSGPSTGSATPTFRSLSAADFPNLTIPIGSINATGTASATTFLRGDGSWGTPAGGSSGWSLSGNSINPSTDFLGTTGNSSLKIRTNNIERVVFDSVGNIKMGVDTFKATTTPLKFSMGGTYGNSTAGNANNLKFIVYKDQTSSYGIGISAGKMEVQANNGGMGFYSSGTEAMRLTNLGVGIGATTPSYPLDFGSALANTKIALYNGTALYGLGVQASQFRLHLGSSSDKFSFLVSAAGSELFAIKGTGGVVLTPMTKAQRDALASPEQGRMVFVSDNGGYLSYYNAGWFKVSAVAD